MEVSSSVISYEHKAMIWAQENNDFKVPLQYHLQIVTEACKYLLLLCCLWRLFKMYMKKEVVGIITIVDHVTA